jgi:hypothetical protein
VPIGERILVEFSMASLGVPLSPDFLRECMAVGKERCWRVFQSQPEFSQLPAHVQTELKAKHFFGELQMRSDFRVARLYHFSYEKSQVW